MHVNYCGSTRSPLIMQDTILVLLHSGLFSFSAIKTSVPPLFLGNLSKRSTLNHAIQTRRIAQSSFRSHGNSSTSTLSNINSTIAGCQITMNPDWIFLPPPPSLIAAGTKRTQHSSSDTSEGGSFLSFLISKVKYRVAAPPSALNTPRPTRAKAGAS